jgi:tryptophanyl-tRNA synthetase
MSTAVSILENISTTSFDLQADRARQFGLSRFVDSSLVPKPNSAAYWVHLGAGIWGVRCAENTIPKIVIVGMKPGRLHLGHLGILKEAKAWRALGTKVLLLMGSFEAIARGSTVRPNAKSQLTAIASHILGADPDMLVDDIVTPAWPEAEARVAAAMPNRVIAMLTKADTTKRYLLLRICGLVVTSILFPQISRGERLHVVFPCGANELPFVALAKLISERMNLLEPSIACHSFTLAIDGKGRMSSRRESTSIFLDETRESLSNKLAGARTGGRDASLQATLGGRVNHCLFFRYICLVAGEDDATEVAEQCGRGKPCSRCKADSIPLIQAEFQSFQTATGCKPA